MHRIKEVGNWGKDMFRGEYFHTIDAKGRVMIPVKVREKLGEEFIVTKGFDRCLWIFESSRWEKIEQDVENMPLTVEEARQISRFIFSGAMDGELDKQGRILLPQNLRDYAGLQKDIVLSGVGSRLEIWDKEKYDEMNGFDNVSAIAAKLNELGYRI